MCEALRYKHCKNIAQEMPIESSMQWSSDKKLCYCISDTLKRLWDD